MESLIPVEGARTPAYRLERRDLSILSGPDLWEYLKNTAAATPGRRARVLLHPEQSAHIHEMLIVLLDGAVLPVERNIAESKSYHVLSGNLEILLFADDGVLADDIVLSAGDFLRINTNPWHTMAAVQRPAVYIETLYVPSDCRTAEALPNWWPDSDEQIQPFLDKRRNASRERS